MAGNDPAERDTLARKLRGALQRAGYEEIRAAIAGHAHPQPVRWREGDAGHLPHVTASKNGRAHVFEVAVRSDFGRLATEERWRLFAYHAEESGAEFVIVVEAQDRALAQAELRRLRIRGRVMAVGA
jgi:Holliday junction resolvase